MLRSVNTGRTELQRRAPTSCWCVRVTAIIVSARLHPVISLPISRWAPLLPEHVPKTSINKCMQSDHVDRERASILVPVPRRHRNHRTRYKTQACSMSASGADTLPAEHPQSHERRHRSRNKKHDPFLELSEGAVEVPPAPIPSAEDENSPTQSGFSLVDVLLASCNERKESKLMIF